MKVYLISGLAADRRIFRHINFPQGFEPVYLDWIAPYKKEPFESYARRLGESINSTEPYVLLGMSLGGMVASELSRQFATIDHAPELTILVSSVPVYNQLPMHFRVAGHLRLHKVVPIAALKRASYLKRWLFPLPTLDKALLNQLVADSDPAFIRWAMHAVLKWRNNNIPSPIWHIHGEKDRILPVGNTNPTHIVKKGGHMIVIDRPTEVSHFLAEALRTVDPKFGI